MLLLYNKINIFDRAIYRDWIFEKKLISIIWANQSNFNNSNLIQCLL